MNDYGMGDFFKKSYEFQQDMVKNWMNAMTGAAGGSGDAKKEDAFAPFAGMTKMYESVYGDWQKQFLDNPWMKLSPWSYNMFNSGNPMYDMFNKMMNSGKSLTDLSAIWQQLLGQSPLTSREEILKFIENNKATYERLAQDFLNPFIPESMRPLVDNARALIKQYEGMGKDMVKPWTEFGESNAAAMKKFMQGDASGFYQAMNKAYTDSFGRMFNVPGMGLAREQNEQIMGQFDSFYKMLLALSELMSLIGDVARENMVTILETYGKLVAEGKQPQSLKEFYDLWLKINEEAFVKVFGTPQFSKIFGMFAKTASEYKIHCDKVLEQVLNWAPFPKNSEMASLYKTVYELRKSAYKDTQRLDAMQEELASLKAAVEELTKAEKKGGK